VDNDEPKKDDAYSEVVESEDRIGEERTNCEGRSASARHYFEASES